MQELPTPPQPGPITRPGPDGQKILAGFCWLEPDRRRFVKTTLGFGAKFAVMVGLSILAAVVALFAFIGGAWLVAVGAVVVIAVAVTLLSRAVRNLWEPQEHYWEPAAVAFHEDGRLDVWAPGYIRDPKSKSRPTEWETTNWPWTDIIAFSVKHVPTQGGGHFRFDPFQSAPMMGRIVMDSGKSPSFMAYRVELGTEDGELFNIAHMVDEPTAHRVAVNLNKALAQSRAAASY